MSSCKSGSRKKRRHQNDVTRRKKSRPVDRHLSKSRSRDILQLSEFLNRHPYCEHQQGQLGMMSTSPEATGQQSLSMAATVAIVGTIIIIIERRWYQIKKLRNLERHHGCKKLPDESDCFGADFFGIAKALELASHLRDRSSLQYTNSLFQKYGETYSSNVLSYRMIFTCNAENVKDLLSTSFANFDGATLRKPLFKRLTPRGIFTVDGADWKSHRGSMRSRLSNLREIVDLSICEGHFQDFCQHVPPDGQVFDAQAYVSALALDIGTLFALGESIEALSPRQSPEKKQFQEDLIFAKEKIVEDGFRGPLRYLSSRQTFNQSCKRVRDYVSAYLMVQNGGRSDGEQKAESQISLLTDQTLDIVLATDSMGTTLSGLFFCLAQDERVVRKLRESIVETIGASPPTWEQLGTLRYVRSVLQEGKEPSQTSALILC
jgi:cytochrome P450